MSECPEGYIVEGLRTHQYFTHDGRRHYGNNHCVGRRRYHRGQHRSQGNIAPCCLAEVKTFDNGLTWEVWWRGEVLFASTSKSKVREMAELINLGRNDARIG